MAVRIGLVEDNPSLIKRFQHNFSLYEEVDLVFAADSGERCLEVMEEIKKPVEVILMDIELPGISGIETTSVIKGNHPDIDIIMITVFEDLDKIMDSLKAGAVGYLLKDETPDEIVQSILEVKEGGAPMTASIARKLVGTIKSGDLKIAGEGKEGSEKAFGISEREHTIIRLLVDGKSYTTIAEELIISPHTVKTHIKNVYKKLHVHSKASLVKLAINRKFV